MCLLEEEDAFVRFEILILAVAQLVLGSASSYALSCDDAYSAAEEAYSYARKGYLAGNLDDIHYYARKARNSADEAMSYADDCGCDDAYSSADDAYTQARRAYNEEDYDYAESYIRRAMRAADDAMSSAEECM